MSYRHLSVCEIEIIASLSAQSDSLSDKSLFCSVASTTIRREFKRHRQQGEYDPQYAEV